MSSRRLTLAKAGIWISRMRLLRFGFLHGRLLGYAMSGLAEFFLDFSDFVVFDVGGQSMTPFGEGFLPLGGGEFVAAELGVNVAEVRMDGGIVTITFDGLVQGGLGFGELVLFVINPAHAVEIGAVVGFLFQGALHEVGGFVEALA